MRLRNAALIVALGLLAPTARATTWIVDDTPGLGVDFNSISEAMAVAAPGDVFIVRAGSYGGSALAISAVVLAEAGVFVTGDVHVSNNAPLGHVALVNLNAQSIYVDPSSGGVLLEDVVARPGTLAPAQTGLVSVSGCTDVRLRDVDVDLIPCGIAGLAIASSRVEVSGGRFIGGRGRSHDPILYTPPPENGGDGILASGASDVHVSRADARDGSGGDLPANFTCGCLIAAAGGVGIRIGAGAKLLLTGSSSTSVTGGDAGVGYDCPYDGLPGNGIVIHQSGYARISGATVAGESPRTFCGGSPVLPIIGPYNVPVPADPTLAVSGVLAAGQQVTYTLTGQTGLTARIYFGRNLSVADLPFVVEDQLTNGMRSFNLGVIPASGSVSLTIFLPGYLPRGFLATAQGETTSLSVGTSLSPSAPNTLW